MKGFSHYLLSFMLVVSPVFSLPSASAAQDPVKPSRIQIEQALEPAQLGEEAQQQIEAIMQEKRNRTPEQRKIDTQLWQTIKQRQGPAVESLVPRIKTMVEVDDNGKTTVELRLHAEAGDELLELLRNIDGEVLTTSEDKKLVRAQLPIDLLEAVAQRAEIRSIRKPAWAKNNGNLTRQEAAVATLNPAASLRENVASKGEKLRTELSRILPALPAAEAVAADTPQAVVTGPPNTQGDAAHRANGVRGAYGVDGTGVKIGVLSDSVRYLDRSQASGNLPGDVTVLPGQSGITPTSQGIGEGTAMLEIIYDIAPGAKLFFATGVSSPTQMAQNIRDLRFKSGCDIIVDDIGWSGELPFQDDTLARAVNDVTKDGALYFSSAGNAGNYNDGTSGTWQGDFKNAGRFAIGAGDPLYTFHDFGGGLISNRVERTFGDGFGFVRLFWADPDGAAENDYDIYLLDSTLTRVFNFSVDDQSVTGFPGEGMVGFFEEGDRIVIANYNRSQPRALYLDTFGTMELALATGGYIAGQAAAADAFAVAAVPASAARNGIFTGGVTTPVEEFSADGPRHIFFNADGSPVTPGRFTFADGGIVRQKPDLAAADGVSTSVTGFTTFFGTSAAAPHAAAIAALIKSAVPTIKKEEMRELLTSTALDIGPAGWDRVAGAGVVSTLNAYLKAKPSPFLEFASADLSWGVGDGDRSVEPGEEGLLQVAFVNNGNAMATGVTAKVSTTTPGVTIVGSDSDYAAIPEGKGGVNLRHFRFRLAPTAPCGLRPTFTVAVSSNQTLVQTYSFTVQTGQPATTPTPVSLRNGSFPIPDGNATGLVLSANVAGFTAPLTKVAFRLDGPDCSLPTGVGIQHDRVSDLAITLTSPQGTTVTLMSNPGGLGLPSRNFCNTLLDDAATTSIQNITTAGAPYTGAFRPFRPFSAFNGQTANGTWTVRFIDRVTGVSGTLRNFSLLLYTYNCDAGATVAQEITFEVQ